MKNEMTKKERTLAAFRGEFVDGELMGAMRRNWTDEERDYRKAPPAQNRRIPRGAPGLGREENHRQGRGGEAGMLPGLPVQMGQAGAEARGRSAAVREKRSLPCAVLCRVILRYVWNIHKNLVLFRSFWVNAP